MGRMVRIFSGRVQGVGFRAAARSVARRFVVTGWVRNEPDGSVRLEVQGEAGEVARYLDALRERMAGHILEERGSEAAPVVGEVGFEIEY